ncbi:RNA-dependent DNA polymerase [Candidatus Woesearchaeota archaeon CG10_big_fil_rev_8_21_14_0_10_32_9]|nr:MAG: RNA-dependent DNA polymerase [Candidatus Woesearchaeota archaeon CG10_big_fil_rev_8_21_14_0_10_32_9]
MTSNNWQKITCFENIYKAYKKTRKGKTYKAPALKFEFYQENNLINIQQQLKNKTYKIGKYHEKIIREPKERTIKILPFRDRVVQSAIHNIIEPILDEELIETTYACRKKKGAHKALRDLNNSLKKTKFKEYVFKTDVSKYFHSINQDILLKMIYNKFKEKPLKQILLQIILSHKSYLGKGIPIGNLLSQTFANLYLNELDKPISFELNLEYFRYMDDIILLGKKKQLFIVKNKIDKKLKSLDLKMHPKKRNIFPTKTGVDFVGYQIHSDKIKLRRKNVQRFIRKIKRNKTKELLSSWKGYAQMATSKIFEHILMYR